MYVDNTWQIPELKGIKKFHWEDPQSFPDGVYWLTNKTYTNIEDIFPQLDILYVHDISFGPDIGVKVIKELTDMIKSRLPPVQPQLLETSDSTNTVHFLKSVHIIFGKEFCADEISILKNFMRSDVVRLSGVEIIISDYGATILVSM
ncbi:hypothetical protein BDQ17DRAFT_1436866 [Cyathus striatus]|nr:hypothetical protein BDQ17DRAFT_1436866 [Cyathus striatus]